jgi:hypothetical protein
MSDNHAHLNEVVENQSPELEETHESSIEYDESDYGAESYESEPEEENSQDQFASKFAALSRKEKALRERES